MNVPVVDILKEGYSITSVNEGVPVNRADGTITLIRGQQHLILVDTGGPWDKDFLLRALQSGDVSVEDIDFVVGTHGHSDHIGNLNLFPSATFIVSYDISKGDSYLENQLSKGVPYPLEPLIEVVPTPGHTTSHVSVVVKGTDQGTVVVAGDLFEREADLSDSSIWEEVSEDPMTQTKHRRHMLQLADVIIPGHGPKFTVTDAHRQACMQ